MSRGDYARACEAVAELKQNGATREVAEHWLSRWRKDKPPKRNDFDIDAIWQHKPALMICRIIQGKTLHCLSGGAVIRVALGYDISDTDLLALTPMGERDMRMDYWWNVVEGAVSVIYRQFMSAERTGGLAQGVGLPFSDQKPDGTRYFLMHTNWRPVGTDWIEGNVQVDFHSAPKRQIISFKHPDTVLL
jgi:hypothetical protein